MRVSEFRSVRSPYTAMSAVIRLGIGWQITDDNETCRD
jgi:hypothetical protein